jgi:hypothetical protein
LFELIESVSRRTRAQGDRLVQEFGSNLHAFWPRPAFQPSLSLGQPLRKCSKSSERGVHVKQVIAIACQSMGNGDTLALQPLGFG